MFLALPEEQLPFVDESQPPRASTPGMHAAVGDADAAACAPEGEARVSIRFALQLPPPLLHAWLRRQRRVTVDFRELRHEDGPTALVALTGAPHACLWDMWHVPLHCCTIRCISCSSLPAALLVDH